MTVRCKFKCVSVTKRTSWVSGTAAQFLYDAEFQPVTSGSEENKGFYEATPAGKIILATYKEDHFCPGQEYYVDFSEEVA